MTMRIRVKLFATLGCYFRDATPGTPFEIEVPAGATLADLVSQLKLPREEVKVFFVSGRARPIDWHLGADDEVGIFPLIAGG
jgi:sulfur-carrier protein